jgi:alpha-1,2-mannosyltransferase
MPSEPHAISLRRTQYKVLGPLFILLLLWVWLFAAEGAFDRGPNGQAFEADFAMFISAASVMEHGGNPYDHTLLYRTERTLLARQHLPILANASVVRVGNPPLFFWLLRPFLAFPFQPVALAWLVLLYGLVAAAFLTLLRSMGWRHRWLPTAMFLLMPQVLFGPFYGNVICLVFVALAFALANLDSRPVLAGALMSIAWMKPPVALPVVLILLVFHAANRRRVIGGFLGATGFFLGLTIAATGWQTFVAWLHGLVGYSEDVGNLPDVASFAGLYVRSVPHDVRLSIEAFSIAVAIILTTLAWHRYGRSGTVPMRTVGWLWALWFLATPYAHFFDEIMLVFPILALVGRDGAFASRKFGASAIYLGFASLLVISAAPGGFQLLWLPLVAIMLCLYLDGRPTRLILARVQPA